MRGEGLVVTHRAVREQDQRDIEPQYSFSRLSETNISPSVGDSVQCEGGSGDELPQYSHTFKNTLKLLIQPFPKALRLSRDVSELENIPADLG